MNTITAIPYKQVIKIVDQSSDWVKLNATTIDRIVSSIIRKKMIWHPLCIKSRNQFAHKKHLQESEHYFFFNF